jgi:hypothetical protein
MVMGERMFSHPGAGVIDDAVPAVGDTFQRGRRDMFHNAWDIEVHAREMQARRMREAARERLADAAARGGRRGVRSGGLGLARLVAMARDRLSAPRPRPEFSAVSETAAVSEPAIAIVPENPRHLPRAQPRRFAEPYAAMVVIARGAPPMRSEEPCRAWDC